MQLFSQAIVNRIWTGTQLRGVELLLLLAIAHLSIEYSPASPSIDELAERIRRSPRTVKRLVRKLVTQGYLEVEYGLEGNGINIYGPAWPMNVGGNG